MKQMIPIPPKVKRWTQWEVEYLIKHYATRTCADIAEWVHHSPRSVQMKAFVLGLRKSKEFKAERSKVGQFRKGHKPFNAGRKQETYMTAEGVANSSRTRFQPGVERETSPTYRQPGFEMLRSPDKTGRRYWWIKPHDGRRMMPKHRYIWEQAHGPIPKGMNIQFKDGDTTNCVLDNLYLISRAAQVRKNWDNLPDERKAACRAKGNEKRNKSIRADKLRLRWGLEALGGLVKRET